MSTAHSAKLIQTPLILSLDLDRPNTCPVCAGTRRWAEFLLRLLEWPSPRPEERLHQIRVGLQRMLRAMPPLTPGPQDTDFRQPSHLHAPINTNTPNQHAHDNQH
jgi:hypothetical protein